MYVCNKLVRYCAMDTTAHAKRACSDHLVSVLASLGNYCAACIPCRAWGLTVEGLLGANFLDNHKAIVDSVNH